MTLMKNSASRRRFVPLIAGLTAFLLAAGGGTAWAYWTAQATATASVTTAKVAVSQTGFAAPAVTKYLPSALSSTRSFTVTNSSTIAGTATVSISAIDPYATRLPISVWSVRSVAECVESANVPTSGVTAGTWGSTTLSTTLGNGASAIYCVRTSIPDWKALADPSGGRTVEPSLTVSINAEGWTAATSATGHREQTAGMYPLMAKERFNNLVKAQWNTIRNGNNPSLCVDVAGAGGPDTKVISWTCSRSANQLWKFLPVNDDDVPLVTIAPKHADTTRLAGNDSLRIAGIAAAEQWYIQQSAGPVSFYQLVSARTGRCLGMNNTSGQTALTTVNCDSPQAQLALFAEA